MNPKQRTFCEEYLIDLNATQAAIRAGYSEKTAYSQGQRLLKDVEVAELVAQGKQERAESVKIDAEWVLRETYNTYNAATKDNAHTAAVSALKLAGQHVDVKALIERKEVENTHKFDNKTDAQVKEAYDAITRQDG